MLPLLLLSANILSGNLSLIFHFKSDFTAALQRRIRCKLMLLSVKLPRLELKGLYTH